MIEIITVIVALWITWKICVAIGAALFGGGQPPAERVPDTTTNQIYINNLNVNVDRPKDPDEKPRIIDVN